MRHAMKIQVEAGTKACIGLQALEESEGEIPLKCFKHRK